MGGELMEFPQKVPPNCTVSHILVKKEDVCKTVMGELGPNATFDEFKKLAKDLSICASAKAKKNPGNLGKLYLNMCDPEIDKLIFDPATPLNKPLGPIKTVRGWHILWITDRDKGGQGKPVMLKSGSGVPDAGGDD